jgi:ketosteroid isomerase-like protein
VRHADELVQSVWAAIERQDAAALHELIHPQAVLEMAMARGESVRGRAAVLATLRDAWQRVHSLSIGGLHPLSDEAVIVEGRSRYPLEGGGFADAGLVWLCEFRDGMLCRQRLFSSVEDARAAWSPKTGK